MSQRKAVGEHDRAPALEARRRGRRTTLLTSFRSATQHGPAQITGRRRVRSKMCDGRRHGVVRVGKRGLAGLWGHERGRVQAAPKHGVHGLAQRSNPYGKHPFQDVRRPAARGRADEAMATGNTAAPCWRLKARPRSRHRTAAPTGSPKNNRDQAIGRSAGWGRSRCAGRPRAEGERGRP